MRQARLKAPQSHPLAYYHCISRVVDRQFVFGNLEKERFVSLLREYEAFCGVRIITFCILSNHFHLLVEVPQPPPSLPSDDELLLRIERLSGFAGNATARQMLHSLRSQGQHDAAEAFRQTYFERMWNLSAFMKLLKQRFTQWFNRQRARQGTLWEERFKSVLIQGAGNALATIAAYIDLNPVRAGLVDDPALYPWCGYADALAGNPSASAGLRTLIAGLHQVDPDSLPLTHAIASYRLWLFGQGEANEGSDELGRPLRPGFSRESVIKVVQARGSVELPDYLRLRVRYFSDGAILGTRTFVDNLFIHFRSRFGPNRKDGARKIKGLLSPNLCSLRNLRLRVFG